LGKALETGGALGEALDAGGAALETGALLAEVVGPGAGNDPAPKTSTQRKRSFASITQVWLAGHAGTHSIRRHNPLSRSQPKPWEQFAQQPPVVARYTPVAPTVAAKPSAASPY